MWRWVFPLCSMLHTNQHVHYGTHRLVYVWFLRDMGEGGLTSVSRSRGATSSGEMLWCDTFSPTIFSLVLGAWLAQQGVTVGLWCGSCFLSEPWPKGTGDSCKIHRQNAHAGSDVSSHTIHASLVHMSHLQITAAWNTHRDPCTKGQHHLPKAGASAQGWAPPAGKANTVRTNSRILSPWRLKTAWFCSHCMSWNPLEAMLFIFLECTLFP